MKDVRALDTKKLHEKLADTRAKLVKLRFSVANTQEKKVRNVRKLRSEISKILTALNERRHGIEPVVKETSVSAKATDKKNDNKESKKEDKSTK